jgi:uncharacterized caspase-like protein
MKKLFVFFGFALLVNSCANTPPQEPGVATTIFEPQSQLPKVEIPNYEVDSTNPRQALIIGNGAYQNGTLVYTQNDAIDIATKLKDKGFSIDLNLDLNNQAMKIAIEHFVERLSAVQDKDDDIVGFFYFSGHGARWKGNNYLIPIDNAKITKGSELKKHAVYARNIVDDMEKTNNGLNVVILDACRNNPYSGTDRNLTRGLTRMPLPFSEKTGTLIAFAADEGQTAQDDGGNKRNGLYTKNLLKVLEHAEKMRLEDVFMQVNTLVRKESGGEQIPWYKTSLIKTCSLLKCK